MKKARLFFFFFSYFFVCCSSPYTSVNTYGAGEFVLDSYKIREGKFSILEMQGNIVQELAEEHQQTLDLPKSAKVQLAGLVEISTIPIDGKTRLFDVLSQARISENANLFKSYIVRNKEFVPVDFYKLLKRGDMSQNIVMHDKDKIYIATQTESTVMIMGEVGCESVISVPKGYISLREALARAGGILSTGDKSYIQVVRGNISDPKIYVLNWKHIIQLPNDSLLLMPGDMVYVAAKPISEWGRFISQLIPFFNVSFRNKCIP